MGSLIKALFERIVYICTNLVVKPFMSSHFKNDTGLLLSPNRSKTEKAREINKYVNKLDAENRNRTPVTSVVASDANRDAIEPTGACAPGGRATSRPFGSPPDSGERSNWAPHARCSHTRSSAIVGDDRGRQRPE